MKIINRVGLNAAFAALVTAMALGLGAGQAQAGTCTTVANNNQSIFGPPNACYFVNSGPIVFNNVVYQGNNPLIFGDVLNVTINLLQFSGLRTPNPLAHIIASIDDLTNPGNSVVNQDEGFESLALTLGGGAAGFSYTQANQVSPILPITGLQTNQPPTAFTVTNLNINNGLLQLDPSQLLSDIGSAFSTGPAGGLYSINAVFSVMLQLDLGGGPVTATGPTTFSLQQDAVPEPASLALLGGGLAGLGLLRRRSTRS